MTKDELIRVKLTDLNGTVLSRPRLPVKDVVFDSPYWIDEETGEKLLSSTRISYEGKYYESRCYLNWTFPSDASFGTRLSDKDGKQVTFIYYFRHARKGVPTYVLSNLM